jgi:hypothetical protein
VLPLPGALAPRRPRRTAREPLRLAERVVRGAPGTVRLIARHDPGRRWYAGLALIDEGYTSDLAAYALRQRGPHRATDLAGGFRAWRDAGPPVVQGGSATLP